MDPGLRFRCGSSSYLISEYMRSSATNWNPNEECNPETMDGYKYLVFGGMVKLVKPRYVLTIVNRSNEQQQSRRRRTVKKATRSFPITLDQIWGCLGNLLQLSNNMHSGGANNVQGQDLKDLSLAFALSRILRCRLEDVTFPWDIRRGINRDLIRERIIKETDVRRALRIMELQLAFISDYFNTRYPIVFWSGLSSLCLSLLLSVATIGAVLWLSVDIRKLYKPHNGDFSHVVHGFNVEVIITWTFMVFLVFKECSQTGQGFSWCAYT
jgi:hypothetical protein